ncbi:MAG TPA: hypothetical protein VGC13_28615 [Longimicrobium sp.]|jgi:hypothetical protein|uniref:hypothetical protein n=1 Tax=Longimicrobium sp. TaxID=2029185 RepID=UPI002ED9858A
MRLHHAPFLLLAACSADARDEFSAANDAAPPAASALTQAGASTPAPGPDLPDADDPRLFLGLDSLRWAEWETHPPTDRDARLRALGVQPIRADSVVEFDPADGYDPNGERARDFRFVDFSGDGVADVIYNGPWFTRNDAGEFGAGEGTRLKLWQVIEGRAVRVMDHHGDLQRVWRGRAGGPVSFRVVHYGCCSDPVWSIAYHRPVQRGDTVRYEPHHWVMGRQELQIPPRFLAEPRRFTVGNDGYLLRASPRVQDANAAEGEEWYAWEGRGNALAEYARGARGTALAEQTDSTGRVWWFVRMDPATPPRDAQSQPPEHDGHPVPAERLGWMSSRFLVPQP